jgi:predicted acyltransferase
VPIPGLGPGAFEEKRNFIQHLNDTYLGPLKGLPSVIPAAALVLIGTALGDLLRLERRSPLGKTVGLLLAGFGLAGLGLLWSLDLAFSKALWTPSYVLFSAGTAAAALGLLYLLIDGTGWRWWGYPLYVFGANAITAYVAPILFKVLILQEWHVNAAGGQESLLQWLLDRCVALASGRVPGGWLYSAAYILVWWLLLWQLYRKRLFLRV